MDFLKPQCRFWGLILGYYHLVVQFILSDTIWKDLPVLEKHLYTYSLLKCDIS